MPTQSRPSPFLPISPPGFLNQNVKTGVADLEALGAHRLKHDGGLLLLVHPLDGLNPSHPEFGMPHLIPILSGKKPSGVKTRSSETGDGAPWKPSSPSVPPSRKAPPEPPHEGFHTNRHTEKKNPQNKNALSPSSASLPDASAPWAVRRESAKAGWPGPPQRWSVSSPVRERAFPWPA